MIFYFSGTGNSQLAAKRIAGITGDELVSINDMLQANGSGDFHSDKPLVFVAPTYAWRIPRIVEKWIRDTRFDGNRDAYFVLTCGGNCGNAAKYIRELCTAKGFRFRGLAEVVMPENYLAMFPTPNADECREILQRAEPVIDAIGAQIRSEEPLPEKRITPADRVESGPVNPLFYSLFVHDKKFTVTNACISCGKCAQRCPLNNITLEGGRPIWHGTCTHCMACIGGCPAKAIEYGEKSKSRNRYYIAEK